MKAHSWLRALIVLVPLTAACTGSRTNPVAAAPIPGQPTPTPIPTPIPSLVAVLLAAGDIADCTTADGGIHAEATAKLLDTRDGMVITAGDNAYFDATARDYADCYGPRWGRHRYRTYPSPGNHEYQVSAVPYFSYFGERAGQFGAGFYSFTLGNWHIVSLNSSVGVGPGSEQLVWLRRDLEDNKASPTARCTLAYWHHPLFTSGPSAGSNALMRDVWSVLYDFGVDIVVNGHDHLYERFASQDKDGRRDAFGIQEYIVGTGGAPLYDFGPVLPNSLFHLKAYGVLRLTLRDVGYDSVFIEAGTEQTFDATLGNLCH